MIKFIKKHHFSINMGINIFGFAISFSQYLNENYKEAYGILLVVILFTVIDLLMNKFLPDEENE